MQLPRVGAQPHTWLTVDQLACVAAEDGLELVVLALLEPREWVEHGHRLIVVVHSCGQTSGRIFTPWSLFDW